MALINESCPPTSNPSETAGFKFPEYKICLVSIKGQKLEIVTPPLMCPVKHAIDMTPNPKARETCNSVSCEFSSVNQ